MDYLQFLLDYGVWLIPVLVLLPYLGMPCLLKQTQRFRLNFTLDEVDPKQTRLPKQVAAFFRRSAEQLAPLGFQRVTHFLVPDLLPNVIGVFAVFENEVENDAAIAVVMFGYADQTRKEVMLQEQYVEFGTEFTDGTEISTNNTSQESVFKPVEQRRIVQMPDTKNLATLYRAHRHVVEQCRTPQRALPERDEWPAELRDNMTREFTEQLDTGYLKMNPSGKFFVMTWKGAFLMTWKQLFPFAHLRRTRRRQRARQLLAEVGPA